MGFSSAEQFELLDREAAAVCASLDDMGDDVDAATERPVSLDVMDATTEGPARRWKGKLVAVLAHSNSLWNDVVYFV